jgi:hypothetical protein
MTDTPIHDATVRAFVADEIDRLFAPLREAVGMVNPLCVGTYCPCGTRLNIGSNINPDEAARVCPVCGDAP